MAMPLRVRKLNEGRPCHVVVSEWQSGQAIRCCAFADGPRFTVLCARLRNDCPSPCLSPLDLALCMRTVA